MSVIDDAYSSVQNHFPSLQRGGGGGGRLNGKMCECERMELYIGLGILGILYLVIPRKKETFRFF